MAVSKNADFQVAHPPDWVDRSIIALSAPPHQDWKIIPNILVTKDFSEELGETQDHVDKTLVVLAQKMRHFVLKNRRDVNIGGVDGVELLYEWIGKEGKITQRQIFLTSSSVLFSIVCTASHEDFETVDGVFTKMLGSIKFS